MYLSRLKYLEALGFLHTCEERPWRSSSLQLSIWENNAKCCFPVWEYPRYFKMLFSKGKYLAAELSRFSPHTHLSSHAYVAFQNKQHHYWLHRDLFKTTLQFLMHQFQLFGWKSHPFSCKETSLHAMGTAASVQQRVPQHIPSHLLIVALISVPPLNFCKFYEMAHSS